MMNITFSDEAKKFFTLAEIVQLEEIMEAGAFFGDDPDLYMRVMEFTDAEYEMPYGTKKARDGDPEQWLFDKMAEHTSYE